MLKKLIRAIKRHCLDCSGQDSNNVINCPVKSCGLWNWRQGVSKDMRLNERKGVKVAKSR